MRVIKAPVRAPKARAHAERWVGSVRRECLDRLLILGRRHLHHVLATYVTHYNEHRPHRALAQRPPLSQPPPSGEQTIADVVALDRVRRCDLLGGLIREYELRASEVLDPPGCERDEEEGVDPLQERRLDGEKVAGEHAARLRAQERPPGNRPSLRCRRESCFEQHLPHRRRRDAADSVMLVGGARERGVDDECQ
jgi:Integrase core domain